MATVVIGAGISGLACAHRLQRAGGDVIVLERELKPGGRARTLRRDGYVIDLGPDAMTAGYTHYVALLNELGLGDRVVPSNPVIGLVRDGRVHDLKLRNPLSLAGSPALSPRAKAQLVRGYLRIRGMLEGVDPYELVRSAGFDDDSTNAYCFGVEHFGKEVANYVIDPAMRLVTAGRASEASIVNLLGAFRGWLSPLINVIGGMDLLPTTLAAELDITYGAEVIAVEDSPTGVTVTYRADDGSAHRLDADHCVITAMYDVARVIWPRLAAASPRFDANLRNVAMIAVTLGYDTTADSAAYVVQVPGIESDAAMLVLAQHNKAPDRAPSGRGLFTVYTDDAVTHAYLEKSDAELEAWAASLLEQWWPALRGHRQLAVVSRWPKSAYASAPGSWTRTAELLQALPRDGRVHIAGDLFNASSMESAIRYGEIAADRIIASRAERPAPISQG